MGMTTHQRFLQPILIGLFVCLAASYMVVSPGVAQSSDESLNEGEEFGGNPDGVEGHDRRRLNRSTMGKNDA